ncbi:MAG: dTDP-4-dehydrorhamnose reductase [Chitinispirillaceae bacterium]
MKLLVIGSGGQLGSDFVREARLQGHDTVALDYPQIDIASWESVNETVRKEGFDAIINCAAFTAVDLCEEKQQEAFALNSAGCANLARAAAETNALLIHISTDYVFSGDLDRPYTEEDAPGPKSVYGKSKLEGEEQIASIWEKHIIFRIAWLYGMNGGNFVKSIRRFGRKSKEEGKPLRVVNDQIGSPTWTVSICRQVLHVLDKNVYGVFHCTSEGRCSWFDFAEEIITAAGIEVKVEPCKTEEFPRPAPRPANSVLENKRLKSLGLNIMPEWKNAFREFLAAEKESMNKGEYES